MALFEVEEDVLVVDELDDEAELLEFDELLFELEELLFELLDANPVVFPPSTSTR